MMSETQQNVHEESLVAILMEASEGDEQKG